MSIEVAESVAISRSADDAWQVMRDVEEMVGCIPGASITQMNGDSFHGTLMVRLGPSMVRFSGVAHVLLDDVARTASIRATGHDERGRTKVQARASVGLEPAAEGSLLTVTAAVDVAGPLAPFARAGGREVTRIMLADFAAQLESNLSESAQAPFRDDSLNAGRLAAFVMRRAANSWTDRLRLIISRARAWVGRL